MPKEATIRIALTTLYMMMFRTISELCRSSFASCQETDLYPIILSIRVAVSRARLGSSSRITNEFAVFGRLSSA